MPHFIVKLASWSDIEAPSSHPGADLLVACLAFLERRLSRSEGPFLCGDTLTLADARAFPHLLRFEGIYRHLMVRETDRARTSLPDEFPEVFKYVERRFVPLNVADDQALTRSDEQGRKRGLQCHFNL